MKKEITFSPAFDKRHPDPAKNYGIHGVECLFVLSGELGAVQFLLFTNWMLPSVGAGPREPMAADLGYHSPKPMYEGQEPSGHKCEHLGGEPCYYDGSGLNAEPVYQILLAKGSDGVWAELEAYYTQTFGNLI